MYSVHDYGAMIADRVRMDAYSHALRMAVSPGSVVLDLGSGAGIFALLACRLGARHVYAIEPSNIIEVGREIAAANNYGGQITFVQQRSEQVSLPERVDVIVSDMRGVLPWLGGNLRALIDARERFLAPGGTIIGRRDTLWAAVVKRRSCTALTSRAGRSRRWGSTSKRAGASWPTAGEEGGCCPNSCWQSLAAGRPSTMRPWPARTSMPRSSGRQHAREPPTGWWSGSTPYWQRAWASPTPPASQS
jgi:SAM-dependent methyltransferase